MLTGIQKFGHIMGAVAGFIPGISFATGIGKHAYYKKSANQCSKSRQNLEATAEKVSNTHPHLNLEKRKCYKKLSRLALLETIPGVNFFAATASSRVLQKLFKIDEYERKPQLYKQYILKEYEIKPLANETQRKLVEDAALIIENLGLHDRVEKTSDQKTMGAKSKTTVYLFRAHDVKNILIHSIVGMTHNQHMLNYTPVEIVKIALKSQLNDCTNSKTRTEHEIRNAKHNMEQTINNFKADFPHFSADQDLLDKHMAKLGYPQSVDMLESALKRESTLISDLQTALGTLDPTKQ